MTTKLNGVSVNAARYNPTSFPWKVEAEPDYESGIISGINKWVTEGETIVIVGGGWGVTAARAAKVAGPSGNVIVYEGSEDEVKKIRETAEINDISERVSINHSIVGPKINLYSQEGDAQQIPPKALPECDVLELDCEGAELEILKNISIRPKVLLVESHGVYGASSEEVEKILKELSYTIQSKEIAEKRFEDLHREQDVYVITATHN
ncbi:FkbM family methyltransferase [Halorubrum salsamenti]|uniref:FkbM family methyltransferase n=1 Tax=Halorubrum salsamenti TaxID=2583990 RepID=UPI001642D811|nr:FkbM family methyltransferase [Halorubrum salsamenti]